MTQVPSGNGCYAFGVSGYLTDSLLLAIVRLDDDFKRYHDVSRYEPGANSGDRQPRNKAGVHLGTDRLLAVFIRRVGCRTIRVQVGRRLDLKVGTPGTVPLPLVSFM